MMFCILSPSQEIETELEGMVMVDIPSWVTQSVPLLINIATHMPASMILSIVGRVVDGSAPGYRTWTQRNGSGKLLALHRRLTTF